MTRYPFPNGRLNDSQHTSDETIKLECTSFVAENIGDVPVRILGRTLLSGESYSVPFGGVLYLQDVRIKFDSKVEGTKLLYVLQTSSQECD